MKIPFAPLQKDNSFGREWFQWFSSVSQGITGLWGNQKRKFKLVASKVADESYLNYTGSQMTFLIKWNDGVQFQNSKLLLEKEDLLMVGGRLLLINDGTIVNTLKAEGNEVLIPDLTFTGEVIIQGTIIGREDRR